jgi:hypothetical protein
MMSPFGSTIGTSGGWPSKVWKDTEFTALVAQVKGTSLGTHSVWNFPSTWAAEHGFSQDHTEIHGQWKGKSGGKTVNHYINVEQLPTDGHVASVLCVGSPIQYMCRTGSGLKMKLDWMHYNVVPGIYKQLFCWRCLQSPIVLPMCLLE